MDGEKKLDDKVKEVDKNLEKVMYDRLAKQKRFIANFNSKQGLKIGTAWLYEKVGSAKIFVGAYALIKSKDDKLGKYIVMELTSKNYVFIDNPSPKDWIPSRNGKIIKILQVMKYGDDDYRVLNHLDDTYYRLENRQKQIERVFEVEENGVKNTFKEFVPEFDENGEPVMEEVEVAYEEPMAVTQDGRDALRKGNEYEMRMQAKRKENESFWDKYGEKIMFTMSIMIMMVSLIVVTKMNNDAQNDAMMIFKGEMEKTRASGVIDIEKLATGIVDRQRAADAIEANGGEAPPK